MENDSLQFRFEAFYREIGKLNDKYVLSKPIEEYFDCWLKPANKVRRAKLYFKDNIDLPLPIREECIEIFVKYFPGEEGAHGLIGYPAL